MRKIVFLTLFLIASQLSAQRIVFSEGMVDGIQATLELRKVRLEKILKEERSQRPENLLANYLEGVSLILEMFLVQDEAFFENHRDHLDELIESLEELSDQDPNKRVLLAEMLLGRSGIYGKYKHNVKAAWGFYRAYNLLKDNLAEFPDHIPTLIPFGVLQTAVGSLPSDYRSLASLFGFDGDIEQGLKMIRKAYYYSLANPKYRFYQNYFGFVYAYVNFELDTKEQVSLFTLDLPVYRSAFFIYLESLQKADKGEGEEALALLKRIPKGPEYLYVPYFTYFQGKVALMLEPELARNYFEEFLSKTKDNEHLKSTYRYLAWYHLLQDQPSKAEEYRQKILAESESITGSDKQAQVEAERGFNKELIKTRLDFDAGRFALVVEKLSPWLLSKYCKKDWEKQEFHYRRGRALQELKLDAEAKIEFEKAVSFDQMSTYAYGNSILQLGLLAEARGAYGSAENYLKQAAKLSGYPFFEGVQQKAKTALSRLP